MLAVSLHGVILFLLVILESAYTPYLLSILDDFDIWILMHDELNCEMDLELSCSFLRGLQYSPVNTSHRLLMISDDFDILI